MKFFKWLKRARENEEAKYYNYTRKMPDVAWVEPAMKPKPSPTTLYPPIEEKEK